MLRMSRLISGLMFASSIVLLPVSGIAHADRFGPPWMDKVTVDQTTLYTSADRSQPIRPLERDTIVVMLGQQADMSQVPDGFVPASTGSQEATPVVILGGQ